MKKTLFLILHAILALFNLTIAQPTITTFSPSSGPIGTIVTITGTNFNSIPADNIVFFGATQATVSDATTTELTVNVPAGASYQFISITDTSTGLSAYSTQPFITTFYCGGDIDTVSFADSVNFTAATSPFYVTVGDLNADGLPDLAIANWFPGTISIFKNTTSGTAISFDPKVDYPAGSRPRIATIGDIDGDGKPDLAVANVSSNTVSIFKNTSTGGNISFLAVATLLTGAGPESVSIGDLDGDGKPDLAVENYVSNTFSVFKNTTASEIISFDTKVDYATGLYPGGSSVCDLDGDSKPDVVITNYTSNTVSVFKNTSTIGTISFAPKVDYATGSNPGNLSRGDLDGDGKPDLAV
jgi:hypothetical protein